uniref:Uncharacterized protein n=1 Tax=Rhizophora mucronata TaxID=61149 RepID=A0A2P2QL20_RHIMU
MDALGVCLVLCWFEQFFVFNPVILSLFANCVNGLTGLVKPNQSLFTYLTKSNMQHSLPLIFFPNNSTVLVAISPFAIFH